MNRRRFLRHVMTGASALAFAPSLLRGGSIRAESVGVSASIARNPWLRGWQSVTAESLGPAVAAVEGRWPADLCGTLYRNGPAWFERAGVRYQHWFDGDGMLHAWQVGPQGVRHRARMIETPKYRRERQAGRFVVPAAGTPIENAVSIRNSDDMNTANTAVFCIGDQVFALWEAGSAIELNDTDLETLGPVTWREDLAAAPFSAHPLRDRDGSIWNFGSLNMLGGAGVLIWHIGADGKVIEMATARDGQGGYLHSFAMTDRHLVFVLTPYRMVEGKAFFERLRFSEELPCRIAVVPKDSLDAPRWFDVDFGMVYHFADAFERGRKIVVRAVRHTNAAAARSPFAAAMRGETDIADEATDLVELHVDLASGRARWQSSGIAGIEFPSFDARAASPRQSRIHVPMRLRPSAAPYANAIASIDLHRGRIDSHRYGDSVLAEEHLFVARPGSRRAGQGWLLGTVLDYTRGRSGLAVLDAEQVGAGPLAMAWLPYTFPLGFHGAFHRRG